jgi:hypothetical protein
MIFEAAAEDALARGVERGGDHLTLERLDRLTIEGKGNPLGPVQELGVVLRKPLLVFRHGLGIYCPGGPSGQKVSTTLFVAVSRRARNH